MSDNEVVFTEEIAIGNLAIRMTFVSQITHIVSGPNESFWCEGRWRINDLQLPADPTVAFRARTLEAGIEMLRDQFAIEQEIVDMWEASEG